ncbi:MAG: sugar transferase [Anaerolineae bacterium]|nr:sugar transferase [Anaerolineae bacterium]MDW8297878.1 sugar transferase [Anaerolineae bacterium]
MRSAESLSQPASAKRSNSWQLRLSERRFLLLVGDTVACLLATLVAMVAWSLTAPEPFDLDFVARRAHWFIIMPLLWLIVARLNGFNNLRLAYQNAAMFARLLFISVQVVIIYLFIFFLVVPSGLDLPRLFTLYYAVAAFSLVGMWRVSRPRLFSWSQQPRRAVLIGNGKAAAALAQTIAQEAPNDYEIIGYVPSELSSDSRLLNLRQLSLSDDLTQVVRQHNVSELILAHNGMLSAELFQAVMACYEQGIAITPMPLLYEQITGRVPIEHVGQFDWQLVLPLDGDTLSFRLYLAIKRLIDVTLALIGLACFAVILPPLALLIRLDSRGPIFYRQERLGRGGKPFQIVKLRSMVQDAEKLSGPQWARKDDPRVTRVGRWLRKTRLDEVPQLWNVLRGEMSIVGPRPERPVFIEQLTQKIPFYRTRLLVAPGLTGWAQICYKYGNTEEDALVKLQYDLYYIRHQSIALDLLIMLRTLGKMLSLSGT